MLEVIENWPGDADDPVFKTEFGPSAELVVLGKLHLWLVNPAQLRHAIQQRDPLLEQVRGTASVVFQAGAPEARRDLAKSLLEELGVA